MGAARRKKRKLCGKGDTEEDKVPLSAHIVAIPHCATRPGPVAGNSSRVIAPAWWLELHRVFPGRSCQREGRMKNKRQADQGRLAGGVGRSEKNRKRRDPKGAFMKRKGEIVGKRKMRCH